MTEAGIEVEAEAVVGIEVEAEAVVDVVLKRIK